MRPLVHVIDDDSAVRDSIRALLASIDLDTACYASARAFLESPCTMQPGCIVLDLRIPDMSGLEVQQLSAKRSDHKPIIFLTGYGDVEASVRAMRQGAAEFLIKPVNDELFLQKVRDAVELNRRQQAEHNRRAAVQARVDLLTPREGEVLDGIVEGYSNKDIAHHLGISHKTVELHRSNVMSKMHARSLAELVRMCVELNAPSQSA